MRILVSHRQNSIFKEFVDLYIIRNNYTYQNVKIYQIKTMINYIRRHIPTKYKVFIHNKLICKINNYKLFRSKINYKKIPIIINNYNRLYFLQKLIYSLELRGYNNIYIIDNNSTYPPLLEYYNNKCLYPIFKLKENIGYDAIWKTEIFDKFKHNFYVYTDSDMQIDDACPDNFLVHFLSIMQKHPLCEKVGFGIRIDNIPDYYIHKEKVIKHETHFWEKEVHKNVFRASIDTTFAVYRPYCGGPANLNKETYRTGAPYLIKHLPWYLDYAHLDKEEEYYINSITQSTHWSKMHK